MYTTYLLEKKQYTTFFPIAVSRDKNALKEFNMQTAVMTDWHGDMGRCKDPENEADIIFRITEIREIR